MIRSQLAAVVRPKLPRVDFSAKRFAGAGHNHDLVIRVAGNVGEKLAVLGMRAGLPDHFLAGGMKSDLQDAIAPLQTGMLILVLILFESAHDFASGFGTTAQTQA